MTSGRNISCKGGAAHVGEEFGGDIGGNSDDAVSAAEHEGQTGWVVTGKDGEAFWCVFDQFEIVADIAAGFFDADDIRDFGKAQDGVVGHADDGAAGYVVDNHRNRSGFGDGFELLVPAFLGGLVVLGDVGKGVVCTGFFGGTGECDGFEGVVGAGAGDNGNAFVDVFDRFFDYA